MIEDLLHLVRAAGADIELRGASVGVVHPRRLDAQMIETLRLHAYELRDFLVKGRALQEAAAVVLLARLKM